MKVSASLEASLVNNEMSELKNGKAAAHFLSSEINSVVL